MPGVLKDKQDTVRVSPAGAAARQGARLWSSEGAPTTAAGAAAGPALELDVVLQYTDGCRRSHSCRLVVPMLQPFRWAL